MGDKTVTLSEEAFVALAGEVMAYVLKKGNFRVVKKVCTVLAVIQECLFGDNPQKIIDKMRGKGKGRYVWKIDIEKIGEQ